jgi:hypothetical protein
LLNRLREAMFGMGRRVSAVGSGFVDTFLRDNRVIPIVLALLALLVFAWIVAGAFLGGPAKEPVSNRAEVAQAQNPPTSDPPAPEVENPDVDTYAAYQFKDPFRQLVAPAGSTTPTTTPTTTPEDTSGGAGGGAGGGADGGAGGGAGGGARTDTDGDGLSDERELRLGLDPANPDTDGDGTLDGQEEEARGGNGGAGGGGGRGDGGLPGSGGQKGALPESGGEIPLQ